jgi:regulator of RNase E activity RraA
MALTHAQLTALGKIDTCTVADTIQAFDVRLRNVGFTDGTIRCCFEDLPPLVGFAVTARIRTALPPMIGRTRADRMGWWASVRQAPAPCIVVIEDVDQHPGAGALVGEVGASILAALGAVGVITNGAVRDLPRLRALGIRCFASSIVPSHAYAHVFDYGAPVRIGGLDIAPGDLLHADRHGVVQVPIEIAAAIPSAAATRQARDAEIVAYCQSEDFSAEGLHALLGRGHGWGRAVPGEPENDFR